MTSQQPGRFVPNNRKGEIPELVKDIEEIIARKGPCLVIIGEGGQLCGAPVYDNCHVIPESLVLSKIKENKSGQVLELQWGAEKWRNYYLQSSATNRMVLDSSVDFKPRKVGTGNAFVRWFACHDHDQKFACIDTDKPDLSDPIVRLSYMYRMALYEADLSRLNERMKSRFGRRFTRHPRPEARVQWNKVQKAMNLGSPWVASSVKNLGQLWLMSTSNGDLGSDLISWEMLRFQSSLDFAACVCYGTILHAIVIPESAGWHKMILLYLAKHSEDVRVVKERLTNFSNASQSARNPGVMIAEDLMRTGGAVAASVESYGRLLDEEKEIIQKRVADNAGAKALLSLQYSPL